MLGSNCYSCGTCGYALHLALESSPCSRSLWIVARKICSCCRSVRLGHSCTARSGSRRHSTCRPQHAINSQDLGLMRKDIRSQKRQLVAQNLKLTDAEATKFWPIYDRYTAELVKINDKKYATIQEYADGF